MTDKIIYHKNKDGSYVHNCYLSRRPGDKSPHIFRQNCDLSSITASLNGYAIIPIEEYNKLIGKDPADQKVIEWADKIKDCDQQMSNE